MSNVIRTGVLELVGINDDVGNNDYGAAVEFQLPQADLPHYIKSVLFISSVDGSGAVQRVDGKLLIFSADPGTTAGDQTIANAQWANLLGVVDIVGTDFTGNDGAAAAAYYETRIPIVSVSSLWFVLFHEDANGFNALGGDDEQFEMIAWIDAF